MGDPLDVDNGPGVDNRTIDFIDFVGWSGNEDGRGSGFNDRGQVAFSAHFTDGSWGVFVSDVVADFNGDYNGDGTVDAADYIVWRMGFGTQYDEDDYNEWRNHFGETTQSGTGAGAEVAVPEPSIVVLLMAVFAFGLRWLRV